MICQSLFSISNILIIFVLQADHVTILTHCVLKNIPHLTCCNSEIHELILTIFVRNVTEKVSNQNVLYFPTRKEY